MISLVNQPSQKEQFQKTFREKNPKTIEIRGKSFFYDENSMMLWQMDKSLLEQLNKDSLCMAEAPYWDAFGEIKFKGYLVFQATYACNLACNYCFVKHHYIDHENSISLQTCIDAVKAYQANYLKNGVHVGWFGGEPTMNWETIYQFTEWVKKESKNNPDCFKKSSFHITTNATLITEEMAEYFAANNFSFIISLDGNEEEHNNARPYANANANNSWKDTMRGLEFVANAFKKAGKQNPITLRSTFDKNGCDLVARLKFLNKLMYDGKAGHVSIEPSCLAESCARNSFEGLTEAEIIAKFQEQYFKAADWFLAEVKAGRKPSFHHFTMPLQRIYEREPAPTECGAGKGYLSIGPKGKVSACHREHESVIGNMYEGIDKTRQAAWFDNRYFNRIGCNDCWMRNFCGGGCRCNSALLYKNLQQPSSIECIFKEMQTKAVIWLMSEMSEKERKQYSKQNYRFGIMPGHEAESMKPCSDPNNCEPCKCKLQERNQKNEEKTEPKKTQGQPQSQVEKSGEKQAPICGLKACEGDNCPFAHCGKQTPEDFQAGLKKINERG